MHFKTTTYALCAARNSVAASLLCISLMASVYSVVARSSARERGKAADFSHAFFVPSLFAACCPQCTNTLSVVARLVSVSLGVSSVSCNDQTELPIPFLRCFPSTYVFHSLRMRTPSNCWSTVSSCSLRSRCFLKSASGPSLPPGC